MLFSRSKSTAVNDFAINTSDRPLANKNDIKYLGVLFDNKLNWEQHVQHVLAKFCIARRVLMKLRHYVPVALRNVYFGIVYSYLQYGVTSWGNTAFKYTRIQIQPNYIVKILPKTPFFRKKLLPIYSYLNLLKFNIFILKVLKCVLHFDQKIFLHALTSIFDKLHKFMIIQRNLVQTEIGSPCVVAKLLRKSQFVIQAATSGTIYRLT